MSGKEICILLLTGWLQLQSLQWKVQAWNYFEVTAPTRLLADGNLKKDYFSDALLICSEQLVDVKPKIDTFPLILSSWILWVKTQSTSSYSALRNTQKVLQPPLETPPAFHISPTTLYVEISPIKGHQWAPMWPNPSHFSSSWGKEITARLT